MNEGSYGLRLEHFDCTLHMMHLRIFTLPTYWTVVLFMVFKTDASTGLLQAKTQSIPTATISEEAPER